MANSVYTADFGGGVAKKFVDAKKTSAPMQKSSGATIVSDSGIKKPAPVTKPVPLKSPTSAPKAVNSPKPTLQTDAGIKPTASFAKGTAQIAKGNATIADLTAQLNASLASNKIFNKTQLTSGEQHLMDRIDEFTRSNQAIKNNMTYTAPAVTKGSSVAANTLPVADYTRPAVKVVPKPNLQAVQTDAGIRASNSYPAVVRPNVQPTQQPTQPMGTTPVMQNQGNMTPVNSNPAAPNTSAPVTPKPATATATGDTKTTLFDYAQKGGYDLKWSDGKVLLNGVELTRDQLEGAGGRLVNGRWTFDSPANLDGLIGKAATADISGDSGLLDGVNAIQSQFETELQGIKDQLGAMTVDQYVAKAWEQLKPMYDFQTNELKGTSEFNRMTNEAGQEARGLGTSGLYGAENSNEDKVLLNAINELFANTNAQALQTGESLMNTDRNRLMDMYNMTKASYDSALDVINLKLEDYYNSSNLELTKQKNLFDIYDSNRSFDADQDQWNSEFNETQKMNQHNIDMDNWTKSFQERNANKAAAAASIKEKKAPWGTDDYDDMMFITRSALIEGLYLPDLSPEQLAADWQQAITEFPELAQDANLTALYQDAMQSKPTLPTLPTNPDILRQPNYSKPNDARYPMINK